MAILNFASMNAKKLCYLIGFVLLASASNAQISTQTYTDTSGILSVVMPSAWKLNAYTIDSYEYEKCRQTDMFIAHDGLNAAIADFDIGICISHYTDVSKKKEIPIVAEYIAGEEPTAPKQTSYSPKKFLKNYHEQYLEAFRNGDDAQLRLISRKKVSLGGYSGWVSEFEYNHNSVEFEGRYHCLLISAMRGNSLLNSYAEGDLKLWQQYEAVIRTGLKNLKVNKP